MQIWQLVSISGKESGWVVEGDTTTDEVGAYLRNSTVLSYNANTILVGGVATDTDTSSNNYSASYMQQFNSITGQVVKTIRTIGKDNNANYPFDYDLKGDLKLDSSGNVYQTANVFLGYYHGGYHKYESITGVDDVDLSEIILLRDIQRNSPCSDLAIDSSNNIIQTGSYETTLNGTSFIRLVKHGSFDYRYNLSVADSPTNVELDSSDNIYMMYGIGLYQFSNSTGANTERVEFDYDISTTTKSNIQDLKIDSSDNIYIFNSHNDGTMSIVKSSVSNLTTGITWAKHLGYTSSVPSGVTQPYGSYVDNSTGDVYVCGKDDLNSSNRAFLMKLNSSGVVQYKKLIEHSSPSFFYLSSIDKRDGFIYVTGADGFHVAKLPDDGSFNGTYGSFTISDLTDHNLDSFLTNVTITTPTELTKTDISSEFTNLTGSDAGITSTTTPTHTVYTV
jgi:hypothetical protein